MTIPLLLPCLALLVPSPGQEIDDPLITHEDWHLEAIAGDDPDLRVDALPKMDVLGRTVESHCAAEAFGSTPICLSSGDLAAHLLPFPVAPAYLDRSPWTAGEIPFELTDLGVPELAPFGSDGSIYFPWAHLLPAFDESLIEVLVELPFLGRIDLATLRYTPNERLELVSMQKVLEGSSEGALLSTRVKRIGPNTLVLRNAKTGIHYRLARAQPARELPPVVALAREIERQAKAKTFGELELLEALKSDSPFLRAAAVRAFEPRLRKASEHAIAAICEDLEMCDPVFAQQVACSFGAIADTKRGLQVLGDLLDRRGGDRYVLLAVRSGLEGREVEMALHLMARPEWREQTTERSGILRQLFQDALYDGRRSEVKELITFGLDESTPAWQQKRLGRSFSVFFFEQKYRLANNAKFFAKERERYELEDPLQQPSFDRGQKIFETSCRSCHLASGLGQNESMASLRLLENRDPNAFPIFREIKPATKFFENGRIHGLFRGLGPCGFIPFEPEAGTPAWTSDLLLYLNEEWVAPPL